jgi:diguanylate cyclase (GGDEF)-like protein
MTDRLHMLEGALDLMEEGVAILDEQSKIIFWNKTAEFLTGYLTGDVICKQCPEDLYCINEEHWNLVGSHAETGGQCGLVRAPVGYGGAVAGYTSRMSLSEIRSENIEEREKLLQTPTLVLINHKLGHSIPVMLRKVMLRDSQNMRIGAVLQFYPAEATDALPRGESGEIVDIERSQAEMEERLDAAHHQWKVNHMPFGLLWITVDQATELRKTHGRDACEAMLRVVEQTLLRNMNPAETIGRWGDDEFLLLAPDRRLEVLIEHARRLMGVARTAEFRWWGDRVSLTVSIGVSQAMVGETLISLLRRARQAMQTSEYEGGNRVTEARGI